MPFKLNKISLAFSMEQRRQLSFYKKQLKSGGMLLVEKDKMLLEEEENE